MKRSLSFLGAEAIFGALVLSTAGCSPTGPQVDDAGREAAPAHDGGPTDSSGPDASIAPDAHPEGGDADGPVSIEAGADVFIDVGVGASPDGGDAGDADAAAGDADAGAVPYLGPHFTDVTLEAGIDYVQGPVIQDETCGIEAIIGCAPQMTGGAAAGDYDGDGFIDLYVTRLDEPGILYRNRGDGTFEDVSVAAGLTLDVPSNGAGWADVDNDGDQDLYVTTVGDTRFYLFINDGGGAFTEEAVERGTAVENVHLHNGFSVSFGDYDRDGFVDIHTTEWRYEELVPADAPSNARLLHNLGAAGPGYFEDVTDDAGVSLAYSHDFGVWGFASSFADFDGDGFQDLAVVADFGSSELFWNDGDGTFTKGTSFANVGTEHNGMGNAIGDYDGDGLLDWFVTSIDCDDDECELGGNGNRLYRNNGDRSFRDDTDLAGVRLGRWGWGAAFFDYDNDGEEDLVMTNGMDFPEVEGDPFRVDRMRLYRNDGGFMTEVAGPAGMTDTGNGKGLLVFDYDRDGDQDVFVARRAQNGILYRNDGGNAQGYLRVDVRGAQSNTSGVGARITVVKEPGAPPMVREVIAGNHFLGQSEGIAHFGLGGGASPVAEVRVRFLGSSADQVLTDVARNQTIVVAEPP